VDCLIIDRSDFCSGASMASSHMLHGGIRYLENGEFRLVREALQERNNLLRNAPHLTFPLPTTIPIFKIFSGLFNAPLKFLGLLNQPAERGLIIIKTGLALYDAFARGDHSLPSHQILNRQKTHHLWPEMNPDAKFCATYYDGGMSSPERLAMEILLDGEAEGDHARALNYVSAMSASGKDVLLRDELSDEIISVTPEIIINAGGPWIDFINQKLKRKSNYIGGTKGSHLIVHHPALRETIGNHELFFEYHDGRIVLIFPYNKNLVLIGTTDIRIDDPDQIYCTEDEIDYILNMVPHLFPSLHVIRDQIVFQFSGVRPLPSTKGTTSQISRDHSVEVLEKTDDFPWQIYNLVGGKWTSYRAFAEQVVNQILLELNKSRLRSTERLPIGGGKDYPKDKNVQSNWAKILSEKSGLSLRRIETLFGRYGTRAVDFTVSFPGKSETPLTHLPDFTQEEIQFLVNNEMVTHLDDLLLRRTKIAWTNQTSIDSIMEIATIIGETLRWDEKLLREEIDRTVEILRDRHAVNI
jgi:glycerol-3-phosphate dehydrogenase